MLERWVRKREHSHVPRSGFSGGGSGLGAGGVHCCDACGSHSSRLRAQRGLGVQSSPSCEKAIFTPSDLDKADFQNSQSIHLVARRRDLQNSGSLEFVTGREL